MLVCEPVEKGLVVGHGRFVGGRVGAGHDPAHRGDPCSVYIRAHIGGVDTIPILGFDSTLSSLLD